jgi:hypothetical protein
MDTTKNVNFKCKHCQKEFQRERSLEVHLCEPKRRFREQNDPGVRLGFNAYLKFYELTQGSAQTKTFETFAHSNYYRAFVKFGSHCVAIKAINPTQFLDWLLKNNKKIDNWASDRLYEEYLLWWLPKETLKDALERGITEIQDYAEHSDLAHFRDYFRFGNANRICHHITTGRISPWIIFNCDSGVEWLNSLTSENLNLIIRYIDPDTWNRKFDDFPSDVEYCKHILKEAGL